MTDIQYRYALDSDDNIVDIQDYPDRDRFYRCLSCDRELRPVLGRQRRHHFRHHNTQTAACGVETYLHKLAKLMFFKTYLQCMRDDQPFEVEFAEQHICNRLEAGYGVTCDIGKHMRRVDLTRFFPYVQLEERDGKFIPDVLLTSKGGEKLYFEVAVTHKLSDAKQHAGHRIIEMDIATEDDIQPILDRLITEDGRTRFLYFKRARKGDFCGGACVNGHQPGGSEPFRLSMFVVHKSGKCILKQVDSVEAGTQSKFVPYVQFLPEVQNGKDVFSREMVAAYRAGVRVKNCSLCRYHAKNRSWTDENPIFCKYLKKSFPSNYAAECQYYRADEKVFPGQSPPVRQSETESARANSTPPRARFRSDLLSGEIQPDHRKQFLKARFERDGDQPKLNFLRQSKKGRKEAYVRFSSRREVNRTIDHPNEPLPSTSAHEVGVCMFCGRETTNWWSYDGKTGQCKCRDCYKKGLH